MEGTSASQMLLLVLKNLQQMNRIILIASVRPEMLSELWDELSLAAASLSAADLPLYLRFVSSILHEAQLSDSVKLPVNMRTSLFLSAEDS